MKKAPRGNTNSGRPGMPDSGGNPEGVPLAAQTSSLTSWGVPLALVVLGLALFGPALGFDFVVWDDGINIYENPYFLESPLSHLAFFWQKAFHMLYIPLTYNAWALAAEFSLRLFGRLDPAVFHGLNVFFHLGNTLLVFGLIRVWSPALDRVTAGLAAAVFLVHPMQIEPMAWVTGFKDVFSTTWVLAALLVYLRARARSSDRWQDYVFSWLLFWAAVLAKPSHVFFAGVVGLLEAHRAGYRWNMSAALRVGVFALPAVAAVIWTRQAQEVSEGMRAAPLLLRPLVALDALTFYFCKSLFPHPIGIDYGRTPVAALQSSWIWLMAAFPVAGGLLLWRLRGCYRFLPGLVFWGLALSPSIGLMPFYFQNISTVADRYQYVAMAGIALVWASLLGLLRVRQKWVWGFIVVGCLAVISASVLPKWRDSGSLFHHALEQNTRSWLGHVNYGSYLVDKQKGVGALEYYEEARRLNPDFYGIRVALGQQLLREGKKSEALEQLREAVRLDAHNATVRMNLAVGFVQNEMKEEATKEFEQALSLDPGYYEAWINYGQHLARGGDSKAALAAWEEALRLQPQKAAAHDRIAQYWFEKGDRPRSVEFSLAALERDPRHRESSIRLALIWRAGGQIDRALGQLRLALEAHPDTPEILNNLAWYTVTKPGATPEELAEAVRWAEQLLSLIKKDEVNFLDTLAVSLAAKGDFERALATIKRAEKVASTDGEKAMLQERQRLFLDRKPYQEPAP